MNIETKKNPSFFTLLIMISFASVNAVLFTPALPEIAKYFAVTSDVAQQTIIWFLVGYTLGQLFYGPLANRFGRKPALYVGIMIQILSSLVCVLSGYMHSYFLLVSGRFFLALGSGVGLKMAFTLVNEFYGPKEASQKISYLTMAFAITPGLSVALGGVLTDHLGWISCFYAGAIYGVFFLILVSQLSETFTQLDVHAFKFKNLLNDYLIQFKNSQLVSGALIMGGSSCFIYIFAAVAPFLAIKLSGMSSSEYGYANLLPPIGLLTGSFMSAQLVKRFSLIFLIWSGLSIVSIGIFWMILAMLNNISIIFSLFVPMMVIFFGLCLIVSNASTLALSHTSDKSHGSAVMNFLNMGLATFMVFSLSYFPVKMLLLPCVFIVFIFMMAVLCKNMTLASS